MAKPNISHIVLPIAFIGLINFQLSADAIKGVVKDSEGKPLYGVIVKVVGEEGKILSFCSSKATGQYSIEIADSIPGFSKVIFSKNNYTPEEFSLTTLFSKPDVTLMESPTTLEEIVVMPSPIKARGDTIVYNVNAMRNVADRTIGDVISHIPGITIDKQGNIMYQGETINKFYIEDMDMLGSHYSIATENIRAEDVVSVSVYENHQPVKMLKDISYSDKAALNLSLRKRSFLRPYGYVEAGAGVPVNEEKWRGELFCSFISAKSQTFINAKASNFGAGYCLTNTLRNSAFSLPHLHVEDVYILAPIGSTQNLPSTRYQSLTSQSYSVNSGYRTGANSTVSGQVSYSHDRTKWSAESTQLYFTGMDDSDFVINQNANVRNSFSTLSSSFTFENNSETKYISDSFLFSASMSDGASGITGYDTQGISQNVTVKKFNIANLFNINIRNGGKIWSAYLNTAFSSLPESLMSALYYDSSPIITQQSKSNGLDVNLGTSYSINIGTSDMLGVDFKGKASYRSVDTYNMPGAETMQQNNNNQNGSTFTINAGPYWQKVFKRLRWRIDVPVNITSYNYNDLTCLENGKSQYRDLIVDWGMLVKFNYTFSNRLKGSLTLRHYNSSGDLTNFITSPIFINYMESTILGNGEIGKTSRWGGTLSLEFRDVMKSLFGNLKVMANTSSSNKTFSSVVADGEVSNSFNNSSSSISTLNIFSKISKIIGNATIRLAADGAMMWNQQLRNNNRYSINSTLWNLELNATIETLRRSVVLKPSVVYTINCTKLSNTNNSSNIYDCVRASLTTSYYPLPSIEVKVSPQYFYNNFHDNNAFSSFFLDASASYKFGQFLCELQISNITNRKIFSYSRLNPLIRTNTTIRLKGLENLITFRYNF